MTNTQITNYLNRANIYIKKETSEYINIKCPICGEGNSTHKARGFVLLGREKPVYNCFNECGSMSFYKFLNSFNPVIAEDYKKDETQEWLQSQNKENKDYSLLKNRKPQKEENQNLINETKPANIMYYKTVYNNKEYEQEIEIGPLPNEAIQYLESRGFKEEDYKNYGFVYETNDIVIPYTYKNNYYGIQTRNLTEKRFHINFFNNPKVTNLEYIFDLPDKSNIFIFESEWDRISTGIKNSISSLGVSLNEDVYNFLNKKFNLIFCFDADEAGDRALLKYIKRNNNILVHTDEMYNFKDFNKLLELGMSKAEIEKYIKENIKTSNEARILLQLKRGIK